MEEILVNEYQTPIKDLHLEQETEEIQEQFYDFINNVPYIKELISINRPRAKDLKRDEEGKIIIDITQPHILEDMDYFRPSAIHFQKYGCYTNLRPNSNPNSEYGKWIREEIKRCWYGYVRPSDGEWITGDYYFFLNYCPIQLIKNGYNNQNIRTIDFPLVWEGHYYKAHYLNQCRKEGKHAAELASRSKGKSFFGAGLLAKRFILGEGKEVNKKVQCVVTAGERKYIEGANQILNMFQYYIDHCATNTQFPSKRLVSSINNLQWTMGYTDVDTGAKKGTLNSVIGITSKDDESKLRGSRGVLYLIEEAGSFPRLLQLYSVLRPSVEDGPRVFGLIFLYGCVCAGTKVWTMDGRYINIENLKKEDGIIGYDAIGATKEPIGTVISPNTKECVRITLSDNTILECSKDHPILTQDKHSHRLNPKGKRSFIYVEKFTLAENLKIEDRVCKARKVDIFGNDTLWDARLVGMLIGDGSYGYNNTPKYSSEDSELLEYIKSKYEWGYSRKPVSTSKGLLYEEIRIKNICPYLRNIGIYGQVKENKRLPNNYQTLTKQDTLDLLGGLFDTDGCVSFRKEYSNISLTQSNKEILEEVKILLRKIGVNCSIIYNKPIIKEKRKDKKGWYRLSIGGRINITNFYNNIKFLVKSKQDKLDNIIEYYNNNLSKKPCSYNTDLFDVYKITNIENIGIKTIYNLSAINSHTYLANDIITHNTAGDQESDFSSMQELMYNPEGYNIKGIKNIYDKEGQGRARFTFFFPGYLNLAGYYDKNGNSDVTGSLLFILKDRYKVKYNSTDLSAITKRIAEIPITPQEAILRTQNNLFPVTQLNERLNQIDNQPNFYNDTYIGNLTLNKKGEVEFYPSNDVPIRDFPLKDNKAKGAIEIFQMPEKNKEGKVYSNRYILGYDPVDDDQANTMSLTSMFVLDLFTDKIVAEYTGRQSFAEDNYEILRLMCLFYNAKCLYENNKKGTFSYFSKMNCTYLLADTPEYLRDKQLIKAIGYGNTSKGVSATLPINNYANQLIRDWLLKPVVSTIEEDNEEKEITIPNLYLIKNRALLKELILFNPDINVDRVRALGLLMLYREEKMILYNGDVKNKELNNNSAYLGNDDFFKNNYDLRFKKI